MTAARLCTLVAAFVMAAGCGAGPQLPGDLMASDSDAWLSNPPRHEGDRIDRSLVRAWIGEPDAALRELLATPPMPGDAELARALRVARLRYDAPSFAEQVLTYLARHPGAEAHDRAGLVWRRVGAVARYRAERYEMRPTLAWANVPGVPTRWRVAGPLSSVPNLDLDAMLAIDAVGLIDASAADEHRGVRVVEALTGASGLVAPAVRRGIYVAEAWVQVDRTAEVTFDVACASPHVLSVGGLVLARRAPDDVFEPETRAATAVLRPGLHRVRVRLAFSGAAQPLWLLAAPTDGGGGVTFVDAPSSPPPPARATPRGVEPPSRALARAWSPRSPRSWRAAADAAIEFADPLLAERLLSSIDVDRGEGPSAWLASQLADVAFTVEPAARREIGQRALTRAASLGGVAAIASLVDQHVDAEDVDAAGEWIAALDAHRHRTFAAPSSLARYYDARGWWELARAARADAVAMWPDHCATVSAVLNDRDGYGPPIDAATVPAAWLRCEGAVRAVASAELRRTGDLSAAVQTVDLLRARRPDDTALAFAAASLLTVQGDHGRAEDTLASVEPWLADTGAVAWERLDRAAAAAHASSLSDGGEVQDAVTRYRGSVEPERDLDRLLVADREAGGGAFPFPDGRDVVADYLASGASYDGDIVYVADLGFATIDASGAVVDVVYQVVQLKTRDALTLFGEIGVPGGAELLVARTIKPDGRTYVPDDIDGKDALSMPALEQGDFVELGWVTAESSRTPEARAYRSPRFYFRVSDGAMHHSSMTYTVSDDAPTPAFDIRGADVSAAREATETGMAYTFSVRGAPAMQPDPLVPNQEEDTPSARIATGMSERMLQRMWADRVPPLLAPSPVVTALARRLAPRRLPERERVRRLYRFVVDEVADTGGFLQFPAAWTAVAGAGERTPLLLTLLREAGFEPDLVFVRTIEDDAVDSDVPDLGPFGLTAIRVPTRAGDIWLEPDFDQYPFDYLRPDAQDMDAIAVYGPSAGHRLRTPLMPDETERHHLSMRIELGADGSAQVQVVERSPVRVASSLLAFLQSGDDVDALSRDLARSLSQTFSGVAALTVDTTRIVSPDLPGELRYSFTAEQVARVEGAALVFDSVLFPRRLATWFAPTATRDRTMSIRSPVIEHATFEIVAPPGFSPHSEAGASEATWRAEAWRRGVDVAAGGVTVTREVRLRPQRIAPADYPAFAEFAQAFEAGERVRIEFERAP